MNEMEKYKEFLKKQIEIKKLMKELASLESI
jgi:hypothetical protein